MEPIRKNVWPPAIGALVLMLASRYNVSSETMQAVQAWLEWAAAALTAITLVLAERARKNATPVTPVGTDPAGATIYEAQSNAPIIGNTDPAIEPNPDYDAATPVVIEDWD